MYVHVWMCIQMKSMHEHMNVWMNVKWTRMNEWMNEWMKEGRKEWRNEGMKEWPKACIYIYIYIYMCVWTHDCTYEFRYVCFCLQIKSMHANVKAEPQILLSTIEPPNERAHGNTVWDDYHYIEKSTITKKQRIHHHSQTKEHYTWQRKRHVGWVIWVC